MEVLNVKPAGEQIATILLLLDYIFKGLKQSFGIPTSILDPLKYRLGAVFLGVKVLFVYQNSLGRHTNLK